MNETLKIPKQFRNGYKCHSEKWKRAMKGNKFGMKNKGIKKTMEWKRKMSQIMIGNKNSPIGEMNAAKRLDVRKKISESKKGSKNPNWKGGIYPENLRIRFTIEYKLWRESVFARDKWKCIWCGSNKKINADHIKSFSEYPELRFAIDNGRTLCKKCHATTENYGWRTSNYTRHGRSNPSLSPM